MNMVRHSVALCVLIGAGLVHGAYTARWSATRQLVGIRDRFDSIPMTIDGWRGRVLETSARELLVSGATAHFSRKYTHSDTGDSVSVLLLAGTPGHLASHAPDVCYPGAGYSLGAPRLSKIHYGPDGRLATIQIASATRGGPSPSSLTIRWAWHATAGWRSPDEPRWAFLGEPLLIKLYLVRESAGSPIEPENDPADRFLQIFLAEVDRQVFRPTMLVAG
jgi:hypothetical protein